MAGFALQFEDVHGGAGTTANVLAGSALEFTTAPGLLSIWGNSTVASTITVTFQYTVGGTPVTPIPSSPLFVNSTANALKTDEDLILSRYGIPASSRLLLTAVATGAATGRFRTFFEV